MKQNLITTIVILTTTIICMGTQCNKENGVEYKYHFVEKLDLSPSQKSYNIGDTIWLTYTNPTKRLFDNLTNTYIFVDTESIIFQIAFNSRYNTPVNPVGGFCDYITANGINAGRSLYDYGTTIYAIYGCNTNNYDIRIGVVPKQKGIYSLDLPDIPSPLNDCPNRISRFPLSTLEYRLNVADCNKDIYLSIPAASRGESPKGYTESRIDNKQVFIVKVE